MLNKPPIVELENAAGNRYLLVSAVSKRARQLLSESAAKMRQKQAAAETDATKSPRQIFIDSDIPSDDVALSRAIDELHKGQLVITAKESETEILV